MYKVYLEATILRQVSLHANVVSRPADCLIHIAIPAGLPKTGHDRVYLGIIRVDKTCEVRAGVDISTAPGITVRKIVVTPIDESESSEGDDSMEPEPEPQLDTNDNMEGDDWTEHSTDWLKDARAMLSGISEEEAAA